MVGDIPSTVASAIACYYHIIMFPGGALASPPPAPPSSSWSAPSISTVWAAAGGSNAPGLEDFQQRVLQCMLTPQVTVQRLQL
jgi:hypothetical protein